MSLIISNSISSSCRSKPSSAAPSRPSSAGAQRPKWNNSVENISVHADDKNTSGRSHLSTPEHRILRGHYGSQGARVRAVPSPYIGPPVGSSDHAAVRNCDDKTRIAPASFAWPVESQLCLRELETHLEHLRADLYLHCQELAAIVTAEVERHNSRQMQKQQLVTFQPNMVTELALKLAPHLEKSLEAQEERSLHAAVQAMQEQSAQLTDAWCQKANDIFRTQAEQLQRGDVIKTMFNDAEARHTKLHESLQRNLTMHEVNMQKVTDVIRMEFETLSTKCMSGIRMASSHGRDRDLLSGSQVMERPPHGLMDVSIESERRQARHMDTFYNEIRSLFTSAGDGTATMLRSTMQEELNHQREQSSRLIDAAVGETERRQVRLIDTLCNSIDTSIKGVREMVTSTNDSAAAVLRSEVRKSLQEVIDQQSHVNSRQIDAAIADAERRHARLTERLCEDMGVLVKREIDRHAEKLQHESQVWQHKFREVSTCAEELAQSVQELADAIAALHAKVNENIGDVVEACRCIAEPSRERTPRQHESHTEEIKLELQALNARLDDESWRIRTEEAVLEATRKFEAALLDHSDVLRGIQKIDVAQSGQGQDISSATIADALDVSHATAISNASDGSAEVPEKNMTRILDAIRNVDARMVKGEDLERSICDKDLADKRDIQTLMKLCEGIQEWLEYLSTTVEQVSANSNGDIMAPPDALG